MEHIHFELDFVPVQEMPPESSGSFLAIVGGRIREVNYSNAFKAFSRYEEGPITHWAEIPEVHAAP